MAAGTAQGGWARHWQVLRDSWALETKRVRDRVSWRDTDFLPAALEVVETPPNPIGRTLLWVLMTFLVLALVWSFVARIDVVALAPGKVIAAGRNKLVQSADGGVVRVIHVRDGQSVRRGQALVTLDPTTSGADQAQAIANLQAAEVDAARSRALLTGLAGGTPAFQPPRALPPEVAATQRALITSKLAELAAKISALRGQAAEARAAGGGANAELVRLRDTLPYIVERARTRRLLAEKGLALRSQQLELEQQSVDHERQIHVQRENANRAEATIQSVAAQILQARSEAQREVLTELAKAEADIRIAREELTKADRRSGLQVVRAPADGIVQQLAVYSEGAVLKPADPILVVVPSDAELIVEAQVLNRDAGFVAAGQPVTVKLEAFPFTRYGTLEGRLAWISRDAVQDDKLGPVYQARVLVAAPQGQGGRGIRVSPGLQATAEIRTDERRVIDYLLSPLERRLDEAGRER